jgi:chromosome segregation ATPase
MMSVLEQLLEEWREKLGSVDKEIDYYEKQVQNSWLGSRSSFREKLNDLRTKKRRLTRDILELKIKQREAYPRC